MTRSQRGTAKSLSQPWWTRPSHVPTRRMSWRPRLRGIPTIRASDRPFRPRAEGQPALHRAQSEDLAVACLRGRTMPPDVISRRRNAAFSYRVPVSRGWASKSIHRSPVVIGSSGDRCLPCPGVCRIEPSDGFSLMNGVQVFAERPVAARIDWRRKRIDRPFQATTLPLTLLSYRPSIDLGWT